MFQFYWFKIYSKRILRIKFTFKQKRTKLNEHIKYDIIKLYRDNQSNVF